MHQQKADLDAGNTDSHTTWGLRNSGVPYWGSGLQGASELFGVLMKGNSYNLGIHMGRPLLSQTSTSLLPKSLRTERMAICSAPWLRVPSLGVPYRV